MDLLSACNLCPRQCGIDRTAGATGFCGASDLVKVARAAPHFWEEPCLSGDRGSGTIFFSHCNLKCVFCQNREISAQEKGYFIDVDQLTELMLSLQEQKVHNINLVTPTHYIPQIIQAVRQAKQKGLRLPVVYNSSGYELDSSIALLRDTVDIFLPDFKYFDNRLAVKYSKAPHYRETAQKALAQMVSQTGHPEFDGNGILRKGVIVRHLLLPGMIEDSKQILRYLHTTYGDEIILSIMNQYTPMPFVCYYPEINRKVSQEEYEELIEYALQIGIEHAYVQEGETATESFIPAFDGTGLSILKSHGIY